MKLGGNCSQEVPASVSEGKSNRKPGKTGDPDPKDVESLYKGYIFMRFPFLLLLFLGFPVLS